jgi:predicted transcriptional regulator
MRPRSKRLTDQELEIMKVVWRLQPVTVRGVYEELLKGRRIAYTSVMTVMKIMTDKKILMRRLDQRTYVYEATRPKRQVMKEVVGDFLNRVFNGSAEPLLLYLVRNRFVSEKELDDIVRIIKERA